MDLKDIKAIVDLMKKNSITEFELEKQDFKIRLKRGIGAMSPVYEEQLPQAMIPQQTQILPAPGQISVQSLPGTQAVQETEIDIKSPMIGTFYRAPSPESAPYVEIGTEVHPDTIVCILRR